MANPRTRQLPIPTRIHAATTCRQGGAMHERIQLRRPMLIIGQIGPHQRQQSGIEPRLDGLPGAQPVVLPQLVIRPNSASQQTILLLKQFPTLQLQCPRHQNCRAPSARSPNPTRKHPAAGGAFPPRRRARKLASRPTPASARQAQTAVPQPRPKPQIPRPTSRVTPGLPLRPAKSKPRGTWTP